jgi:hypothetical protein
MLVILIHQMGRGLKRLVRHSSRPVLVRSGDCPYNQPALHLSCETPYLFLPFDDVGAKFAT